LGKGRGRRQLFKERFAVGEEIVYTGEQREQRKVGAKIGKRGHGRVLILEKMVTGRGVS